MLFRQISDPNLAQYAYLIGCQRTMEAVLIDPERDIDRYIELAKDEGLHITAVTETHIHADFLSGARELAERTGAKLHLSDEGDADWKYQWLKSGNYDATLIHHGDRFAVGNIELEVLHTPGHTPEHVSFLIIDHGSGMTEPMGLISGDFVFVGDLGRPDLLESAAGVKGAMTPSAKQLYRSVQSFLKLPDFLQVWPAHGAGSACGKALGAVPTSTVGYERIANSAIKAASRGEDFFVKAILDGQPEPPLYFARMKRLNKEGVPLLGELPMPWPVSLEEVAELSSEPDSIVIDTRLDRTAFMRGHVRGSLYAPLDRSFPTVTGSYLLPEQRIYLVAEEDQLDDAVRELVRIGLDKIEGFISPRELDEASGLVATEVIDFEQLRQVSDALTLDVRGAAEYAQGHIPSALNIAHTRLLDRLDEVPANRELFVYCLTGARAAAASAMLEHHGFKTTYVDDDFANWQTAEAATTAGC